MARSFAKCHPNKYNKAFGLCISCYKKKEYWRNPDKYRKRSADWREKNPEKAKAQLKKSQRVHNAKNCRKYKLKSQYNLTPESYQALVDKQNNLCAICQKKETNGKNLSIDHCHTTGKIRALLCGKCNAILGLAHDNIDILQKAINYLKIYEK